jgi:transcriptional regulator with XRE-family HTH domain
MILPDERCAESRDGMELGEIRKDLVEVSEIDIEQMIRSGRNAVIDSAVQINGGEKGPAQWYAPPMQIGQKLRELRESKQLSQGDLERLTGLLRCYTSRVEHGHTVPSIATLEKYAHALDVPLYRFFTDGQSVKKLVLPAASHPASLWGAMGKERAKLRRFAKALSKLDDRNRALLLGLAQRLAGLRAKSSNNRG